MSSASAQQSQKQLQLNPIDTIRINQLIRTAYDYIYTKPDSAVILGQDAYTRSLELGYTQGEALSLNRIAGAYVVLGEYAKALRSYRQAKTISEDIKDVGGIHRSLNNIGDMYMEQEDWLQALNYFRQARQVTMGRASLLAQSVELENIGECYLHLHQVDSVLGYEQQALTLAQKADAKTEADILRIMGETESEKHHPTAALQYFQQSVSYNLKYGDTLNLSHIYLALGHFFNKTNRKDSALYYTLMALRIAQSGSYLKGILEAYKQLAVLYEGTDDRQALQYEKLANAANDSLFGWKRGKQMALVDFEEQQQQRDIETAKREERIRIWWYTSVAGAALFLLLAVVLYRNNRHKQKVNVLLKQQKDKIQTTLQELKSTQLQLIQKEKMASLGELTAGIAHEIQNPLNFVNNFSEVNNELVDELKQEAQSGNINEVIQIADEIKGNEQKITHHGKRADAIVKSMLQHSRANTGEKQPTNINALADEYLRLSYQAMCSKNKNFNATIETHFDESIGEINVLPQDISRVFLNLFNNAFYAVYQKKQQLNNQYEPKVSVSTKKQDSNVEITVKDNGTGIPENLLSKIFQPFFTTKPSGQGTGLGLSLSYDIVKAHGGELKVLSEEGSYTEFAILLPIS